MLKPPCQSCCFQFCTLLELLFLVVQLLFLFKDVVDSGKRRSQGGDSKYGFSTSVRNSKSNSIDMYSSPPLESAEDLPMPPPPGKTGQAAGCSTNGNLNGTSNTSSSGSMSLQNNSSSSISKRYCSMFLFRTYLFIQIVSLFVWTLRSIY